jgi:hypothetical protein
MARPILHNSCARATTAAESRFRIDVPIAPCRAARVIGLDDDSVQVVADAAHEPWRTARFYACDDTAEAADLPDPDDLRLRELDRGGMRLGDELEGVDVTVMVASNDDGAAAASHIGLACSLRGITTAGLVLGSGSSVAGALASLRPYARVLLVPAEPDDLVHLLTALRA